MVPLTEADPDQPTTSGSICVPQDPHTDLTTILRLPKTKALTIEKGKGKCGNTETMPIVVYGDPTQLWEQMPSPPKARPPFATWAMINPKDKYNMTWNIIKEVEIGYRISIFIFIDVGVLI